MATISEFNTASIIITVILIVIILLAILLTVRQKKKGHSCCGSCNKCSLCSGKESDISQCIVKDLSKDNYKDAISLLELQKKELANYKSGQKYIFYKCLTLGTTAKGVYFNDTLEGFAILNNDNSPIIKNFYAKIYTAIKEKSEPYRNYALSIKEKANHDSGILLIAINPLISQNKIKELLLN